MADGAANPYVATAAVLQAARLGVANDYPLAAAETKDCLESQDASTGVAANLGEALQDLVADQDLTAAVGETLVQNLVFTKEVEIERVSALSQEAQRDYYIHYI